MINKNQHFFFIIYGVHVLGRATDARTRRTPRASSDILHAPADHFGHHWPRRRAAVRNPSAPHRGVPSVAVQTPARPASATPLSVVRTTAQQHRDSTETGCPPTATRTDGPSARRLAAADILLSVFCFFSVSPSVSFSYFFPIFFVLPPSIFSPTSSPEYVLNEERTSRRRVSLPDVVGSHR